MHTPDDSQHASDVLFGLVLNLMYHAVLYSLVFAVSLVVLGLIQLCGGISIPVFWSWLRRLGLFLAVLLVVGDLFNALWGVVVWGHFYVGVDYRGSEFLPYRMITQDAVDERWGSDEQGRLLGGATMGELQCLWGVFAVCAWGSTGLVYGKIRRMFRNRAGGTAAVS